MKLVLLIGFCLVHQVFCDITLSGPKCGKLTCKEHEYCSNYTTQCTPCSTICDPNHHNYQEDECTKGCQDYIHDIRYVRIGKGLTQSSNSDYASDIQKLYTLVTVTLTLVLLIIFSALAILLLKLYNWSKKHDICALWRKFRRRSNGEVKTPPNNGMSTPKEKRDLKLEMPTTPTHSDIGSPVTVTTSITTRRPAEDSALDYAYDNHAMSGTRTGHSAKTAGENNVKQLLSS